MGLARSLTFAAAARRAGRSTRSALIGLAAVSAAFVAHADGVPVLRSAGAVIGAGELGRRLAALPVAERRALGSTDLERARALLERVLLPELLSTLEARSRKLDQDPAVGDRHREILRDALEEDMARETRTRNPVTPEDVRRTFDAQRARFETPARIQLWRILVDDEALARRILADAAGTDGITRWSAHAREHSLDKATHLRRGELGFVRPDGSTDVPRVRVDPALFAAAAPLADGELVPEPVREAGKFAAVWRRGSLPAVKRTLEEERAAIEELLARERLDKARRALLDKLRREALRDHHPEHLALLPESELAQPLPRGRPRLLPHASANPRTPEASARGLR